MTDQSTDLQTTPEAGPEITSDDKLWGALSYIALIAVIVLLMEDKKKRPFLKYHAVQAIACSVVLLVVSLLLGFIPFVGCVTPLIWLVLLWPALDAFRGNYTVIPVLSDFIKKQGWA